MKEPTGGGTSFVGKGLKTDLENTNYAKGNASLRVCQLPNRECDRLLFLAGSFDGKRAKRRTGKEKDTGCGF